MTLTLILALTMGNPNPHDPEPKLSLCNPDPDANLMPTPANPLSFPSRVVVRLAAISGDVDLAACLLRHRASPNLKDSKGCTALHRALFWGHTRVVEMLLSTRRCDTSSANHAMERPLYIAALRGHPACLKLLLDVEPKNAPRNYHDGYTPLHAAVIGKSLSCLQLLLRHGFEANASNRFGQTALHLGARLGGEEAARILLAHSANCILRDEKGHTALQVANSNGHYAVAEQLCTVSSHATHMKTGANENRRRRRRRRTEKRDLLPK